MKELDRKSNSILALFSINRMAIRYPIRIFRPDCFDSKFTGAWLPLTGALFQYEPEK